MSLPRVLLLTDVALDSRDPGAIFLRALCSGYPRERLAVCQLTLAPGRSRLPDSLVGASLAEVRRPREHGFHRLGRLGLVATRWPLEQVATHAGVPRVVAEVCRFAQRRGVDLVCAVLNGTTVNAAAPVVARRLGVPLVTLVWDPPEYRLRDAWGLRGGLLRARLAEFAESVRSSARCAVMSEGMRDDFQRRFGVPTVLMRLGVPREEWREPRQLAPDRREFVIGYAGSLYARTEWDALVAALDSMDWRVADREARVRVLSGHFAAFASRPVRYEFGGWHTPESTLDQLADADLCYLPYWFDPSYADVVRMSFPSKLSTYVAAACPVFFHGPAESSPATFLRRFAAGACCHSLEPADIAAALTRCAEDPDFRRRALAEGRRALEEELDLEVFHARFAELIGVAPQAVALAESA